MLPAGAGHHNVFSAPRAVPFYDIAVFVTVPVILSHDMSQPFGKIKRMSSAARGSLRVRLHTLLYPVKIFICPQRGYDVMKEFHFPTQKRLKMQSVISPVTARPSSSPSLHRASSRSSPATSCVKPEVSADSADLICSQAAERAAF